jgi:hypothetical protein
MQKHLHTITQKYRSLHPFSRFSIRLGFALMAVFYILALAAKLYVPYATEYFEMLAVYRGCLEAAPAFLAVGVTAGLLGDLILRNGKANDDSSHPDD